MLLVREIIVFKMIKVLFIKSTHLRSTVSIWNQLPGSAATNRLVVAIVKYFCKMSGINLLKVIIFLSVMKYSESVWTETQEKILHSINEYLGVKHFSVVKGSGFKINRNFLFFVKTLSQKKIYASFLSVGQMNESLHENYHIILT